MINIKVGDQIKLIKKFGAFSQDVGDISTVVSVDSNDGSFKAHQNRWPNIPYAALWFNGINAKGETTPLGMKHKFKKVEE